MTKKMVDGAHYPAPKSTQTAISSFWGSSPRRPKLLRCVS